jgi:hypothetical protein
MARALRIPFLVDLIRTDDPVQIRAFAQDQRLDRCFTSTGPLLNRFLMRKVRRVLALDGVPLPSAAARDDEGRARAQAELQAQLNAAVADPFDDDSIVNLAKAVCSHKDAPRLELAVQEAVGRLFAVDYHATDDSWAAAQLLDRAAHSMNPLAAIYWRMTGRITQAQGVLAAKVHNDRAGVHATGIAIHNLVRGFAMMRSFLPSTSTPSRDTAVARCLKAPESVLRQASFKSPVGIDGIEPSTLVVLDLNAAQQRDSAPEIVFMAKSWSECPAAAWVPAFLGAVWDRALQLRSSQTQPVSGPFRSEFARTEAAHRLARYRGLLACNLVLQTALGLMMLVAPIWISTIVAAPPSAAALVRVWGLMLLFLVVLYTAGWFDPIFTRWPNVVGIVARGASTLLYLFLGGGFLWFALYDVVFALALLWAYSQAIRAELMTRP